MESKLNVKRLLITIGLVVFSAGTVGGITWYLMDQQAKEDRVASEKAVQDLQKKIDDLGKPIKSSAELSNNNANTTDPTSGWKTYSSDGIEFKYPAAGYNVSKGEYTRGILFTTVLRPDEQAAQPATPSVLTVSAYVKASSIPLANWIASSDAVGLNYLSGIKAAKVGNSDGYTFLQSGMVNYSAYAVAKGDTVYIISTINPQDSNFNTILSSFKF